VFTFTLTLQICIYFQQFGEYTTLFIPALDAGMQTYFQFKNCCVIYDSTVQEMCCWSIFISFCIINETTVINMICTSGGFLIETNVIK
jgi:hypothetical protein